jgi:hypothetical protein
MKRVFISGPLLAGDDEGCENAAKMVGDLVTAGYSPFVQHLFVRSTDWSVAKFAWLLVADCVLRLEGFSWEQDRECLYAVNNYIPVYTSVKELMKHEGNPTTGIRD